MLNTIVLGDCLKLLDKIQSKSVDAIITDPPFTMAGGLSNGFASRADDQFFRTWFTIVCEKLIRVIKPEGCMFFWCDWRTIGIMNDCLAEASETYEPWRVSQMLAHDREMIGMGKPFRNQLDLICFVRGNATNYENRIPNNTPNIFRKYWYYGKHDNHPSEKDVDVAKKLVEWATNEEQLVLDPFTGSGTVCIASKLTNKNFIGIITMEGFQIIFP